MTVREAVKSALYGLYVSRLRNKLRDATPPRHVGMIIDGNRRWANSQYGVSVAEGHEAGANKMREFLHWCDQAGVENVTLYLLSTDNLTGRSDSELNNLVRIIAELAADLARVPGWRVHHVGDTAKLPESLRSALVTATEATAHHSGLHINLAVGYGGRHEITEAVRDIIREHEAAGLGIDTLADDMLWQSAHSELYFVEALGPDLREIDFFRALRDFAQRQRRFGT